MLDLKVSKIDAAKRQLETAIRLYFNDADPVSIHTLTGAAHKILSDLNKKVAGPPMLTNDAIIKEEYKKEFWQKINEARNHFKHADNDSEAVIDFNPEINEILIYDACMKYEQLTGEFVPYVRIFGGWFVSGHLDFFMSDPKFTEFIKIRQKYKHKSEFFSAMLSVSGYLQPTKI